MSAGARTCLAALVAMIIFGLPAPAHALFHLWRMTEIYSNADGSVQFVEFEGLAIFQPLLNTGLAQLTSGGNLVSFPNDLPNMDTMGASFLIGTPDYAASPGAVAPDYTFPAGFFSVSGSTIDYGDASNVFVSATFGTGELPTNGTDSLHVNLDGSFFTAPNSLTNFATETGGIVPEPSATLLVAIALTGLALGRARVLLRE